MWKLYTDTNINFDRKIKEQTARYSLFSQPRFLIKIDQLRDFQSSMKEKGNIIMINIEGTKITGKKGFAIVQGNTISWWHKKSKGVNEFLDYLNKLNEEKQKDGKDRKKDEKPQEEKHN